MKMNLKKSEILKKAKIHLIHHKGGDNYICNILDYVDSAYCRGVISQNNLSTLQWWIAAYTFAPRSHCFGVEAWLVSKKYLTDNYLKNHSERKAELYEYRLLWLDNMIEYWEYKENN